MAETPPLVDAVDAGMAETPPLVDDRADYNLPFLSHQVDAGMAEKAPLIDAVDAGMPFEATADDAVTEYSDSRPPEGSSPDVFGMIESMGYDAEYVISNNLEIDAAAKEKPITEATLADPTDLAGMKFIEASKILMPLFKDRDFGETKDPAQWGLEFMGWFNWNLPSMGMSIHKIQNAPDDQKLALLYMMELYQQKDITWDGTKRAFRAAFQDVTTYFGLGTFGIGAFLGASAKQATKATVMAALRASLPAAKVASLEGALYAGVHNLMEQEVKIEGGRQDEFNFGETALVAGAGAAIAPLIVGAGSIGSAAARQIAKDVKNAFLRSGKRPMGTANVNINAPEILQTRIKADAIPVTDKIKTPERLKLRLEIAKEYSATPARLQEKKVFFVVGPPASGKSTVADPLAKRYGARIYDSDEVKAMLPEFDNGVGGPAVHDESNLIMFHAMRDARRRGDNIVLPLVGKGQDKVKTILANFQKEGYEGHIVFMDLPVEEAAARAAARFKESGWRRWVDPEYVLSVKDGPSKTYEAVKGLFKSHVKYSNDVPQGTAPKLIEASE
jgi:predicted kinase